MKRSQLLLNPLFLISLAILLINDHYLKAAYPSFLTGKLSDFSGLIMFSWFILALAPSISTTRRKLAAVHLFVGLAFFLWKVTSWELIVTPLLDAVGLPTPYRVKDVTDLLALIVLPFSYLYATRQTQAPSTEHFRNLIHRLAVVVLLTISSIAIIATSPPPSFHNVYEITYYSEANQTCAQFLFEVEQKLLSRQIIVEPWTQGVGSTYSCGLEFDTKRMGLDQELLIDRKHRTFDGELLITCGYGSGTATVDKFWVSEYYKNVAPHYVDSVITLVLSPIFKHIQAAHYEGYYR